MNNIPGLLPVVELRAMEAGAATLIESNPRKAYDILNGIKQHIEACVKREQEQISKGGAILGAIAGLFIPHARVLGAIVGAFIGYKVTEKDIEKSLKNTEHYQLYEDVVFGMAVCRRVITEIPEE